MFWFIIGCFFYQPKFNIDFMPVKEAFKVLLQLFSLFRLKAAGRQAVLSIRFFIFKSFDIPGKLLMQITAAFVGFA